MKNKRIAFIGGGNMAASLIGGLIANGMAPSNIRVGEPDAGRREWLRSEFGVEAVANNHDAINHADVVVLAVKPQQTRTVLESLAGPMQQIRPLLISIVAGIRESAIQRWSGDNLPIVRVMPNTPALVGAGAAGLYANPLTSDEQKSLAESLLRAVGTATWTDDEEGIDLVTAVSGSGPAYFFLLMEIIEAAAIELGMPAKQARLLTLETALGAGKLALESQESPAELRQRVTSPGGTTEAALKIMTEAGLPATIEKAIAAAASRSRELADILEN